MMRPADQLGAAALAYANLGYRVLPLHHPVPTNVSRGRGMLCSCRDPACGAVGKHPRTPHGLNDATGDPAQLGRWWRHWPQANIGLVTGEVADVLDIDGPAGRAALCRFTADHDLRLDGPLVRTGSGWHLYLAPTGSGNRARLLEQVDWRGRGGYVVAPPSRHASGRPYQWLRPLTAGLPPAPAPLHGLLDPARAHPAQPVPAAPFRPTPADHPYGRTALEQELAAVAHAPKGRRNHTLYQAGIRLYSLVAGGVLARDEVEAGLLTAAETSRLLVEEPTQTRRTLASAERTGRAHPRGIPTSRQPDHPAPVRRSSRQARGYEDRERNG
jgi:bifunctional DNA primase/polymerase-like protein